MATFSKHKLEELLVQHSCHELLHPWSESCVLGSVEMALTLGNGGLKFFTLMYAAQLLFKANSKKKIIWKNELKGFMMSIKFVMMYGLLFTGANCFFRKIFGYYSYYVLGYISPILSGSTIFLENPQRRPLTASTFLAMALEGCYRRFLSQRVLRLSKLSKIILFMVFNGMLMCFLKEPTILKDVHSTIWFFFPSVRRTSSENYDSIEGSKGDQCTHDLTCVDSFKKEIMKFGMISFLLSSSKVIALNIKTPSLILGMLFQWKNFNLMAFVMSYVGLFKAISCYLYQTRGDSLQNTFLAGTIAGLSYALNSSQEFLFSMLGAILQVTGIQIKNKYEVPRLPYTEICFILANMYLLNLLIFDQANCPKYLRTLFDIFTGNKTNRIYSFFQVILEKAR